jgi:hypothetical protein
MKITVTPNDDYRWKWNAQVHPLVTTGMVNWCANVFGKGGRYGRWTWYFDDLILFVDHEDATLFALTWDGTK